VSSCAQPDSLRISRFFSAAWLPLLLISAGIHVQAMFGSRRRRAQNRRKKMTKRAITGLPTGEIRSVRLIPWEPGVQGIDFAYADGRQIGLPIGREEDDEYDMDDRR